MDYLKKRQVDYPLINRFSLGASINNWQITNLFFHSENAIKNLFLTNLVWVGENKQASDFFGTHQLIIPLTDIEGRTVAFASRKIESVSPTEATSPKYKYLPSYQYYRKSALLYNYTVAKRSRTSEYYVVEGFFDVISLTKNGFENCVALLGTNLSLEQIKLLIDLKKRIILFLDSDPAGQLATVNITLQLLKQEIDCEIVKPDYQGDPDEICCQISQKEEFNSFPAVQEVLQKREKPYPFILRYYFEKWEIKENPQRIKNFISEMSTLFQEFKINIRHFLIEKISQLVNWKKEQVEIYFFPRFFLVPHPFRVRHHGQKIIWILEKKIIFYCSQERFFWLSVLTKHYFFSHPLNRKNWRTIHHYYLSVREQNSTNRPVLEGNFPNSEFSKPEEKTLEEKEKIDLIFQKIEQIKSFMEKIPNQSL